jgi:hypothetical protein
MVRRFACTLALAVTIPFAGGCAWTLTQSTPLVNQDTGVVKIEVRETTSSKVGRGILSVAMGVVAIGGWYYYLDRAKPFGITNNSYEGLSWILLPGILLGVPTWYAFDLGGKALIATPATIRFMSASSTSDHADKRVALGQVVFEKHGETWTAEYNRKKDGQQISGMREIETLDTEGHVITRVSRNRFLVATSDLAAISRDFSEYLKEGASSDRDQAARHVAEAMESYLAERQKIKSGLSIEEGLLFESMLTLICGKSYRGNEANIKILEIINRLNAEEGNESLQSSIILLKSKLQTLLSAP